MSVFGEPGLGWIAAGLVLMVLEVLTPGAFLVWLGLAAIGTGMAVRGGLTEFAWQVLCFAGVAGVLIGVALWMRRRHRPKMPINTPQAGLVGRVAYALAFDGLDGRVRLGDSDWAARLQPGSASPEPMAALRVVAVEGTILVVVPAEMAQA